MDISPATARPVRTRATIVTGLILALAGLVMLLATLGGLTIWGVRSVEAQRLRANQSLAQLENVRAIDAAFNRYLLGEVERRLRGGGDPSESREAAILRGALLNYRRTIGAEIALSASDTERASERAGMIHANALAELFETIETRSILDRLAGRDFDSGEAARNFLRDAVEGRETAFRAVIAEVIEDERTEAARAFAAQEDLRSQVTVAWLVLAVAFLVAAGGFAFAFYRGLIRPIGILSVAAEGMGTSAGPNRIEGRLPGEFSLLANRFNAMAERIGSEQQRLQREVAARTDELEAANARLSKIDAARRRFLVNASHELRTPVTVLLGEAQVALRARSGEREALERIAASGGYLKRRLDDLMRLARSEDGELTLTMAPCDLGTVAGEAVNAARAYAAASETTIAFEPGAPIPLNGDAEALRQAVLALLDNAIKFSPPGGIVGVRLMPRGIEITDSGPGFEGADPAALFERYVQEGAGRRAGGTGLGLAIVKWIADKHGARICAEERAGGGALFRMEFAE